MFSIMQQACDWFSHLSVTWWELLGAGPHRAVLWSSS